MKLHLPINLRHFAMACTFVATSLSASALSWDEAWSQYGSKAAPTPKKFTESPEDYLFGFLNESENNQNRFVMMTHDDFADLCGIDDHTFAADFTFNSGWLNLVSGGVIEAFDIEHFDTPWQGGRRDVWMNFSGGYVHSIVGGDATLSGFFDLSEDVPPNLDRVFEGDVHIQVGERVKVGAGEYYDADAQSDPVDAALRGLVPPAFDLVSSVTGGNLVCAVFGDPSVFRGNSYVSLYSAESGSLITGGNHVTGLDASALYEGNTYLGIYNVQKKSSPLSLSHEGLIVSSEFLSKNLANMFQALLMDIMQSSRSQEEKMRYMDFFTKLQEKLGTIFRPQGDGRYVLATWDDFYGVVPGTVEDLFKLLELEDEVDEYAGKITELWESVPEPALDKVKSFIHTILSIATLNNLTDSVIGGNTISLAVGSVVEGSGATNIVVDLQGRKGGAFEKTLIGGDHVGLLFNHAVRTGDTNVTILNANGVDFMERVVGGSRSAALHSSVILNGSTHVNIASGTYRNHVIGGMMAGDPEGLDIFAVAGRSFLNGDANVTITGGEFEGYAYSFKYAGAKGGEEKKLGSVAVVGGNLVAGNIERGVVNVIEGKANTQISGGSFAGHVVGGTTVLGRAENFSKADIHVGGVELSFANGTMVKAGEAAPRVVGGMMLHTTEAGELQLTDEINKLLDFASTIEDWEELFDEPENVKQFVQDAIANGLDPLLEIITSAWKDSTNHLLEPGVRVALYALAQVFAPRYDERWDEWDYKGFRWSNIDGSKIDDYEGNVGITLGDVQLTIGSNAVVYDVVGGSWVSCALAPKDVVKQGHITVNLGKGATILGSVFAGGIQAGETALTAESTTVNIEAGVRFAGDAAAVVSGGFLCAEQAEEEMHQDVWSSWRENASAVKGDRSLNFTSSADYGDSLAGVIFTNFDVVNVAADAKVQVGALLLTDTQGGSRSKITLSGGGELSLVPGELTITTTERRADGSLAEVEKTLPNLAPVCVDGATLRLAPAASAAAPSKVQKVEVLRDGVLHVDLAPADQSRRELQVSESLSVSAGGTFALSVNVSSDRAGDAFIVKEQGGSGATVVFDDAQIQLTIEHLDAELMDTEGDVLVVLVDKVLGGIENVNYTVTAWTEETLEKWFRNTEVRLEVDDQGRLVITNAPEATVRPSVERGPGYHEEHAITDNGRSGGALMDEFFPSPSENSTDRKKVEDAVFERNVEGKAAEADRLLAAMAGASVTVLGSAVADDVERQLRLMRNRVQKNADAQDDADLRHSFWVNAESDHRDIGGVSTDPGYKFNSWGGSLGLAYTTLKQHEYGLALTAMYGDLRSKGPDALKSDVDTYYLSGYAQLNRGRWSHSFVATAGRAYMDGIRMVNIGEGYGSYTTSFETEGYQLGLLYEVSRMIVVNADRGAYLKPVAHVAWRHTSVDGYKEKGSDAALCVDDQTLDSVTLAAGLHIGGYAVANRRVQLAGHALVKAYLGDTQNKVEVGFADRKARAKVQSREYDRVGVELGGSAALPLRSRSNKAHALFLDANAELREAYTNLNATLGYKVQF